MGIVKKTLSEQIYLHLREEILNQTIKCGEKLTLKMLKEEFQVSHTPIREALTRLVEDDLVTYYSNVGVRVISFTENDIREIFEFMRDLDAMAMGYALKGDDESKFLSEIDEIAVTSGELLAVGNLPGWKDMSDAFHLVFYRYANNSRLEAASKKMHAQMTLLYNLYQDSMRKAAMIQEEHEGINRALQAGEIDRAWALLREHFNHDRDLALEAARAVFVGEEKAIEARARQIK